MKEKSKGFFMNTIIFVKKPQKSEVDNMKRDLFVFGGQSNMMGASVFEPQKTVILKNSFEYKHKPKRLGAPCGAFVDTPYPCGEFSYSDIDKAYSPEHSNGNGESLLSDYWNNTFFCPAMSNLKSDKEKTLYEFSFFSEATAKNGVTLAPFLAERWESRNCACAYTHIAKGGVSIDYYLTPEMSLEYSRRIEAYNRDNGTSYSAVIDTGRQMKGAAEYFFEKSRDFFKDAEKEFCDDDLSNKCFFWLQGESDANSSAVEYETKLDIIWDRLKGVGFTHFFCIRVGYFGANNIYNIMQAQEHFTKTHTSAYTLTRAVSFFPFAGHNDESWFTQAPGEEYEGCRDSFYGFNNQHINEKGFSVIAEHAVENLYRVLVLKREVILEKELVASIVRENDRKE